MKKTLLTVCILSVISMLFFSCANNVQEYEVNSRPQLEELIYGYADAHNQSLDYIKSDIRKSESHYSEKQLKTAISEYLFCKYDIIETREYVNNIENARDFILRDNFIDILNTRSINDEIIGSNVNQLAQQALIESISEISMIISNFGDEAVLGNVQLLNEMHNSIIRTFEYYSKCVDEDGDVDAIARALGVLYGSLEYWIQYDNVEFWSRVILDDSDNRSRADEEKNKKEEDVKSDKDNKANNDKKDDGRTLSKSDYIITIAAADSMGALVGCGVASIPASGAVSALAALYFNVK